MAPSRRFDLFIAQTVLPLPCFFPSVSSVKTNLMPVDYVELLGAAAYPLFLAWQRYVESMAALALRMRQA